MRLYCVVLVVVLLTGCCRFQISEKSVELSAMEPSRYSNIEKLTNLNFESLLSGERVSLRGPVGFFLQANESMQYRLLCTDGDGYGGVALSVSEHPEVAPKYTAAADDNKTLWVVVQGSMQQYETKDQINRQAEPDAIIKNAEILAYYETELHEFPEVQREK